MKCYLKAKKHKIHTLTVNYQSKKSFGEKPAQVGKVPTAVITLNYNFMNKLLIFNSKCITAEKLTQETDGCLNVFERKCLRKLLLDPF